MRMYFYRLFTNIKNHYKNNGVLGLIKKVPDHIKYLIKHIYWTEDREYKKYMKNVEPKLFEKYLSMGNLEYQPEISIIMPLYNVEPRYLREAVDSIREQTYENWELCIHNDASTKFLENIDYLEKLSMKDSRVKFSTSDVNENISLASNHALDNSTGEYTILMDNDDIIDPRSLEIFVRAINKNRDLKYIYSDFDKIDIFGKRTHPVFKVGWSPHHLLSMMYTNHLHMFRTDILKEIGGFRKGYEAAQDYDLVLRYSEKIEDEEVLHIPVILYHWRMVPGSTAITYEEKGTAKISSRKALKDTVKRRKLNANVENGMTEPSFRLRYAIEGDPKVSVIIPTYNYVHVLKKAVDSVLHKNDYENVEILIINNRSDQKETLQYLKEIEKDPRVKVLDFDEEYNFSKIQNFGSRHASGEHLLLLNNDVEAIHDDWIRSMLELSQLPEVGAVGCMLLYPTDKYQHVGIVTGIRGIAGHIFRLRDSKDSCYMGRAYIIRNVTAVTAACLMIKKEIFDEVGGFDENIKISFNDVDFCLKVGEAGFYNLYTPHVTLYHHESISRGSDESPERIDKARAEMKYVQDKWGDTLLNDPYHNPNITLEDESYTINLKID